MTAPTRNDPAVMALALLSLLMMGVRFYAAKVVGFGDSEALYACYALHPQAAYLDHPGLVGVLASSLGGGAMPSPESAHVATAALATLFPWLVVIVARAMGAAMRPAVIAGIVTAVVPEIGVGLFAMTPDLLLSFLWLAFLGIAASALGSPSGSGRAAAGFLAAGLLAGAATTAKLTGLALLAVLLVATWMDGVHRKTIWPYLGVLVGAVPLCAVLRYESLHGFPMFRHRLVDTQHDAHFSLRNIGAVFGGQLVYLSPVVLVLVFWAARDLFRHRKDDASARLLFVSFVLPLAVLIPLCLWSRVAEPHWLAPPLLALPIHAARSVDLGVAPSRLRKVTIASIATGLALVLGVHAWVLSPSLLRFAPKSYDPKVDITNELYGWPQLKQSLAEILDETRVQAGPTANVVLVGPTWMVCAQLQVTEPAAKVGCDTKVASDFDDWLPRAEWQSADALLFVTDDRATVDVASTFPMFRLDRTERVSVVRGGHVVRTFRVSALARRALALTDDGG